MSCNEKENKYITFPEGIPGFEELKTFYFIKEETDFYYLQSTEQPEICFVIVDPYEFKADYSPTIRESYFEKIGGGSSDEFALYTMVTLRESLNESTLNLAGPILIHIENRKGIQVVVEDKAYTTRHKLIDLINEGR